MVSLAQAPGVPTGPQFDNRRIAAALIDLGVPLAIGAVALAAGLSMTKGLALVAIGWTLYYFFALESGDGQTLGKRVMKLRVVSADGSPATMEQIAKRTVVRILDGHIVGLVVMLATGERRQRLGDIVAGTVVTEAGPVVALLSEADPELSGGPPNQPARRGLRRPAFPKPALDRLSLGRLTARPSASEPAAGKRSRGLPSLSLPALRLPSLRKRAPATERHEPIREGSPAATPATEPFAEVEAREPFAEVEGPEPMVSYEDGDEAWDYRDSEPLPGLDVPEPLVELEREPVVELDEPVVDYEDREPVVELDDPELALDYLDDEPLVELGDPDPAVEVAGPPPVVELERVPSVELEREPSVELDEPRPEPDPENASEPTPGEERSVKPIETVSAIDLVMQDAEERRATGR